MKRNLKKGDIVLIQDSNKIRGQWKLGKVSEVFPGEDGIVRKVHVIYKNPKQGEPAYISGVSIKAGYRRFTAACQASDRRLFTL